ncbi:hypothetical protein FXO38_07266 [Capsicum annuum]|nr:hypothetical protein FXO38_07266 [Capsicum annuum]
MESLHKNSTWDLVRLPKDKKVVRCKWVLKNKEGPSGVEDAKYKARLVAKGYSQRSSYDSCVYFKEVSDGSFVYLILYVDDMLIAAKDIREIIKVKTQISKEFDMKNLSATKKILGMEVLRARKNSYFKLSATLSPKIDDECNYTSRVPYSSAVGSLIYAMVCSQPDLSYVASAVRRYMVNPRKEYWKAVQWIFRYLYGSADVCLHFGQNRNGVIRTKHIDVWYYFMREIIAHGDIMVRNLIVEQHIDEQDHNTSLKPPNLMIGEMLQSDMEQIHDVVARSEYFGQYSCLNVSKKSMDKNSEVENSISKRHATGDESTNKIKGVDNSIGRDWTVMAHKKYLGI